MCAGTHMLGHEVTILIEGIVIGAEIREIVLRIEGVPRECVMATIRVAGTTEGGAPGTGDRVRVKLLVQAEMTVVTGGKRILHVTRNSAIRNLSSSSRSTPASPSLMPDGARLR